MAAASLRDRLGFLSRLPTLIKGTSDDDVPCPGYLFEEIAKISHESAGSSHCLLEYLLNRLQNNSCHVKLKVLKILLYMSMHGSPHFLLQLKRNSTFIQEAAVFAGPLDPLHGNSLYQKVRAAAQVSGAMRAPRHPNLPTCPSLFPNQGVGGAVPEARTDGPSSPVSSASTGESLLTTIQKAAEVVASAVRSSQEAPSPRRRELREDTYQPVMVPSPGRSCPLPKKPPPASAHKVRVSHQPGQAGGGWEESDSGRSSQNSSQENGELSRMSDSYSKSGSDGHSGTSREVGSVADRVEADSLGDCLQEVSLVSALTHGSRVFLTRTALSPPPTLLLLSLPPLPSSQRAMCAISSLMCSDLLSHDQIFAVTQQHLQHLSQGSPGPVANKATKILRQFEALCQSGPASKSPTPAAAARSQRTEDLLTDMMPFVGETILKPMSLVLLPSGNPTALACPSGMLGAEAATCDRLGLLPASPHQQGAQCRLSRSEPQGGKSQTPGGAVSLFAGMELVAPSAMVLADAAGQPCTSPAPRTLPCAGSTRDSEDSREVSAFSFLNM
uniref:TEPSIN adaptor related protein complex 4 accessory protein n=1 Tax=Sphenodon punctatus TaxID=8508 RepID=A0A8D0HDP9_SPHPU